MSFSHLLRRLLLVCPTTSHPRRLQESNQNSDPQDQSRNEFLSLSTCFNSAPSYKNQHMTHCTLPGGKRGSTVSRSTSKSCKAEGILIRSTRARMASERRPGWHLGWPFEGGGVRHVEAEVTRNINHREMRHCLTRSPVLKFRLSLLSSQIS